MTPLEQIALTLGKLDTRLSGIENRLIAIETNIDILMHDAQQQHLIDALATPVPRRGCDSSYDLWDTED